MHEPADVDGQLSGFRPRQQHAVVERMQKTLFRNPALALHQIGVHQRDLSGWSTEADEAEFQPVPERLRK